MRNRERVLGVRLLAAVLSAVLLCGCTPQASVGQPTETASLNRGSWEVVDGFALDSENAVLVSSGKGTAWNTGAELTEGWSVQVNLKADNKGVVRILLGRKNKEAKAAVRLEFLAEGVVVPKIETISGDYYGEEIVAGEIVSYDKNSPITVTVSYYEEVLWLDVALMQNDKKIGGIYTGELTKRTMSALAYAGVDASVAGVTVDSFGVGKSEELVSPVDVLLTKKQPGDEGFYRDLAKIAVQDLLDNFWEGDYQTGHLKRTWDGLPGDDLADHRGSLWETSMAMAAISDLWAATGDDFYKQLLVAEADYIKTNVRPEEFDNAGGMFFWATDDCGWIALKLLSFYHATGDMWFVESAITLLDSTDERWYDPALGSLYYKDDVDYMSLYEVSIALSWLRIWEITGQQRFYDLALRSYNGMQNRLGRDDGLYYCEANIHLPEGDKYDIGEGGSTSFLTGNMGMAAMSVMLHRITGEQKYLDQAYKTTEGLLTYYDRGGVLINDRDGWTNGAFAGFYASYVLSLPNTEQMQQLLNKTALSIMQNARTVDGYYGGSWSGPATGSGSVWFTKGTIPQQVNTSATSVMIVTAAAILEAKVENYIR